MKNQIESCKHCGRSSTPETFEHAAGCPFEDQAGDVTFPAAYGVIFTPVDADNLTDTCSGCGDCCARGHFKVGLDAKACSAECVSTIIDSMEGRDR